MKADVLALGDFPPGMMAALAERFTAHHFVPYPLPDGALAPEAAARIRAIATEANRGASRELIARLPRLEIIACFGVGTNRIDLAAARERAIAVTNTPGVMADDVADLAIGLMLASARGIVAADRFVRDGQWTKGPIGLARTVTGKRLGVLGLGAIGRAIADRAAAFRMTVRYCGPRRKPDAPYRFVADPVALARESDFLMIACKGGPETQHLVSAAVIAALGPAGTLINVARGSVVDEAALIAALRDGRLGAAALDVFATEPQVSPELITLPNLIVQPHHGAATIEAREAIGRLVIDNIAAKLEGRPLPTPVIRGDRHQPA
jgi:lactate dehydrogenase-like 2-hydroxyacid dehydrogenase